MTADAVELSKGKFEAAQSVDASILMSCLVKPERLYFAQVNT
jgi:hypothetical protein